ncbi:MAG: DEAD/DEAH box helicase [Desulfurococcaceae archaeon]
MIILKTRKWLTDSEFKEILKIADYIGYENGYKRFVLNMEKAFRNLYTVEDVLELIKYYQLDTENSIEDIRKELEEFSVDMEWDSIKGVVKIRAPKQMYTLLKSLIHPIGGKLISSTETYILFELFPYRLHEHEKILRNHKIPVKDPVGLLSEKKLAFAPRLKDIVLRDYQKEALDKWVENQFKGIIALPTGSGKTIIGVAAIVKTSARTLIIVYTKEQMFQWKDFILRNTDIPQSSIGLFHSEEKKLAPITITTYQSGFRNINMLSPFFDLLIVDEVHHLPADKFKHIAMHSIAKYRMGLSATPIREDGKHEELFPLLGGVVYYKTPSELSEAGYLAPYRIETVRVNLLKEEFKLYQELRKKFHSIAGNKDFKQIVEAALRGDERAREALKIHSQIRMLLSRSTAKINKAIELARMEYHRNSKIIIFTQYIDQAKEIAEKLGALLLTGETPSYERKKVLEEFKKLDRGILVVTTVGDEGLDIPDANVGIIVSGTGSRRQFTQRLGRLLRPKPNGGEAVLYEIVLARTSEEFQARRRKNIDMQLYFDEGST